MTALGYLMLGIIIGLGVAGTISAMGATFRQSQEGIARDESWESIRGVLKASEASTACTAGPSTIPVWGA